MQLGVSACKRAGTSDVISFAGLYGEKETSFSGLRGRYVLKQGKMAFEERNLTVNAHLLSLASLASTFQCCGFLVSLLMLQRFCQMQYIVTQANPGLAGYPTSPSSV